MMKLATALCLLACVSAGYSSKLRGSGSRKLAFSASMVVNGVHYDNSCNSIHDIFSVDGDGATPTCNGIPMVTKVRTDRGSGSRKLLQERGETCGFWSWCKCGNSCQNNICVADAGGLNSDRNCHGADNKDGSNPYEGIGAYNHPTWSGRKLQQQ